MTFTTVWELPGWTGYLGVPLDVDEHGCTWLVESERGWRGSTGVRLSGGERPRRDGELDGESFRTGRIVELQGTVIAPDSAALVAAMERGSAVLSDTSILHPLTVTELDVPRLASVRLAEGVDIVPESPISATWTMVLRAPDHRKYSAGESSASTGLPASVSGLTVPFNVPFSIPGGGSVNGSVIATNAGSVYVEPTFEVAGPVTNPRIDLVETGQTLDFDIVLAVGEVLVIDCSRGTVLLGGTANRRATLTTSSTPVAAVRLLPGPNQITFRAASSPGGALLTARWRSAVL